MTEGVGMGIAAVASIFILTALLTLAKECSRLHKQNEGLRDRNATQGMRLQSMEQAARDLHRIEAMDIAFPTPRATVQRENEVSGYNVPKDDLRAVDGTGGQNRGISIIACEMPDDIRDAIVRAKGEAADFTGITFAISDDSLIASRAAGEGEPWPLAIRPI